MVGVVGIEPTHPEETDLQSAATLQLRRTPINFIQLTTQQTLAFMGHILLMYVSVAIRSDSW